MKDKPKLKLIVSDVEIERQNPEDSQCELEFDLHLEGAFSLDRKAASKEEVALIAQSLISVPEFQKELLIATREVYKKWIDSILE